MPAQIALTSFVAFLLRLTVHFGKNLHKRNKAKADFTDLVGKWTPDPAFDEIIASQRKIDPRKWK